MKVGAQFSNTQNNEHCDNTPSENIENESQHANQKSEGESQSSCVTSQKYLSITPHKFTKTEQRYQ